LGKSDRDRKEAIESDCATDTHSQPAMSDRQNYTQQLQQLMKERGISSFRQLSQRAGVSERQLKQLRQGKIEQMRLEVLLELSEVLQVSLNELLAQFSSAFPLDPSSKTDCLPLKKGRSEDVSLLVPQEVNSSGGVPKDARLSSQQDSVALAALQQEYKRLQQQLEMQQETLIQEFQRSSLQAIESWLIYWSAAAAKAKENPNLPAVRLLPLVKPIEQLLQQWQVEAIASVGEELDYDPQWHQLIEGTANPGDRVRVRNAGYCHRGQLLFRAKVSPVG
jgi:DNA-binding Xre family transcriptional regulator/molecular chaperone GrpE (heat shock protein)